MANLRFCMLYTFYSDDEENEGDIKRLGSIHPQKAMRELGITYKKAVSQSIADQWWFCDCKNIPEKLPPFLTYM